MTIFQFNDEIGIIVRDTSIGFYIVNLEVNSQVVFRVRFYISTIIKKLRKIELKATITDDAIEDAFLGNKIVLVLRGKRPCFPKFDGCPPR